MILGKRHTIWVNYNKLTTSSLEIIVSKGNHPQMALIQVSELLNLPRYNTCACWDQGKMYRISVFSILSLAFFGAEGAQVSSPESVVDSPRGSFQVTGATLPMQPAKALNWVVRLGLGRVKHEKNIGEFKQHSEGELVEVPQLGFESSN